MKYRTLTIYLVTVLAILFTPIFSAQVLNANYTQTFVKPAMDRGEYLLILIWMFSCIVFSFCLFIVVVYYGSRIIRETYSSFTKKPVPKKDRKNPEKNPQQKSVGQEEVPPEKNEDAFPLFEKIDGSITLIKTKDKGFQLVDEHSYYISDWQTTIFISNFPDGTQLFIRILNKGCERFPYNRNPESTVFSFLAQFSFMNKSHPHYPMDFLPRYYGYVDSLYSGHIPFCFMDKECTMPVAPPLSSEWEAIMNREKRAPAEILRKLIEEEERLKRPKMAQRVRNASRKIVRNSLQRVSERLAKTAKTVSQWSRV